jgi:hypothetical protein
MRTRTFSAVNIIRGYVTSTSCRTRHDTTNHAARCSLSVCDVVRSEAAYCARSFLRSQSFMELHAPVRQLS